MRERRHFKVQPRWWAAGLLGAAMALFSGGGLLAQSVTIGNGTSTQRYPLGHLWGYERSAALYTAAEMSAVVGNNITSVAWDVSTSGAAVPTKVYLATTASAPLTAQTWATMTTGATLVYDASVTPATGWFTLTLVNPFAYNGGNLLVLVETNYGGNGGGTNPSIRYTTTTGNNYHQTWTADGSPPTGIGTVGTSRPNIQINYVSGAPCSGTPAPGNTTGPASICPNVNFTLGLQNITLGSGVTYQWYASTDGGVTYNPAGPNASSWTTSQTVDTWYRCEVACTEPGGGTGTSTAVQVTMNSPNYANYNNVSYAESFEAWSSRCSTTDIPSANWSSYPVTGENSWRRNDQGTSAGWASSSGSYSPAYSAGTYSARFHSWGAASGQKGSLLFHVNMGAATGNTRVSFDHINTSGTDLLKVFLSTDGGVTETQLGSDIGISATWANKAFDFNTTSATTVIRLEATSDYGSTDIGVDNFKLEPAPTCLAVNNVATTLVTPGTAAFQWGASPSNPSNGYEWEVRSSGAGGSGAPGLDASGNVGAGVTNASASGLTANTTYTIWVRANCGNNDFSTWVASPSFTTPAASASPWSEPFTTIATPSGWNTTGWSIGSVRGVTGNPGNNIYKNIYGSGTSGTSFRTIAVGPLLATDELSFDYKVANYSSPYAAPAAGSGNFVVDVSTNFGGTWTNLGTVTNDGVAGWRAKVYSLASFSSQYVQVRITGNWSNGDYDLAFDNFLIGSTCSGTPAPGNTVSSAPSVCASANFTLSMQTPPVGSGISYQWQSADDQAFTLNVANLGTGITQVTSQTSAKWYRCVVTCSNSGQSANSTELEVGMKAANLCHCTPTTTGGSTYYVSNFTTTGGITNISNASGGSAGGYQDHSGSAGMSAELGNTINYSMTVAGGSTYGSAIWIDLNQDGIFQPSEQLVNTGYLSSPLTGSFIIPMNATPGTTRMRILATYTPSNPSNPCSNSGSGEYEDYAFTVMALPPCVGTPAPGNTTGPASICSNTNFTLGLQNATSGDGVSYQWYASTASANGPWTAVGTNAATYGTTLTQTTWYYCAVTCNSGPSTGNSDVLQVTLSPVVECYCTTIDFTSDVEPICNVTFAGINNTSSSTVNGSPGLEDFTSEVATVQMGGSYPISVTGNTNGTWTCAITAFFDWNRDGIFETMVDLGTMYNTVCSEPVTGNISVPAWAAPGTSRMRVAKNFSSAITNPCGSYSWGQAEDYTVDVLPCGGNAVVVSVTTDLYPNETSWELLDDQGGLLVASGSLTGNPNTTKSWTVCLSGSAGDGCYGFRVLDSYGDGITNGGWELRTTGNRLILRDVFDDDDQSPSATPQTPSYGSGHSFCLPLGPSRIMANECNVFTNGMYDKVYCSKVTGATQYQFEFSNPDAGYMRRIARPHNYVVFYEMVSSPLVPGVVYFTRARTNEGGPLASAHWGSGCDLGLGIAQVVQCTQLIQAPAYGHSCNETRSFTAPYNYLYAKPVTGATTYTFKITGDDGNYNSGIEFVRNTYILALGWGTNEAPALTDQTTYQVQVRVTVNGIEGTYCGTVCNVTIDNNPNLGIRLAQTEGQPELSLWPNPNNGQHLNVALSGLDSNVSTADVRLMDLTGRVALGTQLNVVDGAINSVIELGNAANGTYLLQVIAGGNTYTQRVVVNK